MVVSCTFVFLLVHFSQAICGMFFLKLIYGADDFPRSVHQLACSKPCLLAPRRFESVRGVYGASSTFLTGEKAEFSHFQFLQFFVIFLLFRVLACNGAVSVPSGVWKALCPGSASVLNALWQGWIVVPCFCGLRAPNFLR